MTSLFQGLPPHNACISSVIEEEEKIMKAGSIWALQVVCCRELDNVLFPIHLMGKLPQDFIRDKSEKN